MKTNPRNRRARSLFDSLERRQLLATFTGTAGDDVITVYRNPNQVVVSINNFSWLANVSSTTDVVVNALGGADTITIKDAANLPLIVNAGEGNDTIRIGDGVSADLDVLDGAISVAGGAGSDELIVDDTTGTNPNGAIVVVRAGKIERQGMADLSHSGAESVKLLASAFDDDFLVVGSAANETFRLFANAGDDHVWFASDLDTDFAGDKFVVEGGLGDNVLEVSDAADAGDDTYTISNVGFRQTLSKPSFGGVEAAYFDAITYTLNAGHNTVNVQGVTWPTTINAGVGNDTFNVSTDGGPVPVVAGGPGLDRLLVDTANAGNCNVAMETNDELAELYVGTGSSLRLKQTGGAGITVASNETTLLGRLDLGDNRFIDRDANSALFWSVRLRNGYNSGTWNGNGLTAVTSTVAANAASSTDAVGMRVATEAGTFGIWNYSAGDTLLGYTIGGDADLDRDVDFDDLLALAASYNNPSRVWSQGNFNYDASGNVNFDDLLILAANYNESLNASVAGGFAALAGSPTAGRDDDLAEELLGVDPSFQV